jgi:epoxide hydrolase-like predicted phosphatase
MPVNTASYKNILFDFGGVIINIDYDLLISAFSKIGLPDFEYYFSKAKQTTLFDDYEKGRISSDDFVEALKKYCKPETTREEIINAWNAMLLDLPPERIELLKKLKTKYRIFLLSNTNDIHIRYIFSNLKKQYGMENLDECFEKVYLSYEMGMRKPDAEIFEAVLKENDLVAGETLFIDDSLQHIETAKKLGIQTYLLDVKKETITDLFRLDLGL